MINALAEVMGFTAFHSNIDTFFVGGGKWMGQKGLKTCYVIYIGWSLFNCICSSYPRFTIIEYISFMGWIKVAETLINPFGEDDEDFQINYLIDRNVHVSYMLVDDADMEMEMAKGQLISKCLFGVIVLTKIATKML